MLSGCPRNYSHSSVSSSITVSVRSSVSETSASCPALGVFVYVCLCVCVAAWVCVCLWVCAYMCTHKGKRLSLIALAHLLILENRLASHRHKQRRQKYTNTDKHTCHKCFPQSQLGPWTICTLSLAAVWTALTAMVYNMDSIVLGQRPFNSRQRSHYKRISLYSWGVVTGGQWRGCVCEIK